MAIKPADSKKSLTVEIEWMNELLIKKHQLGSSPLRPFYFNQVS